MHLLLVPVLILAAIMSGCLGEMIALTMVSSAVYHIFLHAARRRRETTYEILRDKARRTHAKNPGRLDEVMEDLDAYEQCEAVGERTAAAMLGVGVMIIPAAGMAYGASKLAARKGRRER